MNLDPQPFRHFCELLRETEDVGTLREHCRVMFASGIEYDEIALVIWEYVSEKSISDSSWLPAASCVNHADMAAQVQLQLREDRHQVMLFGQPAPEFRRTERPAALRGTLEELRSRLREIASSNDWFLTERCLLGIADQSDAETTLMCVLEQLLCPDYLGARSGAWWTELRIVTVRSMVEIWQRYGDDAILPVACRIGARQLARPVDQSDAKIQLAMRALAWEYSRIGDRGTQGAETFDGKVFREQLNTDDIVKAFGAITNAWNTGASVEQIGLAMTMHCVERIRRAVHVRDANWDLLKNDLMAAASIGKLSAVNQTFALKFAYHAAWQILQSRDAGPEETVAETTVRLASSSEAQIEAVINEVTRGNPIAAMAQAEHFLTAGTSGIDLLRRLFLAVGYDCTYAGQRCMIDAWYLAEGHPQRNQIVLATVGWEASYRRRREPAVSDDQHSDELNSEANQFIESFGGSQLSDAWRTHTPIVVEDGVLRFSPIDSAQLVTRRKNFSDFELAVDVRIVYETAGIIVRWNSPNDYYMVQVGMDARNLTSNKVGWFHVFSPKHCGFHRDDLAGGRKPKEGKWYRLGLKVQGFGITLSLHAFNGDGSIGDALIEELAWNDPDELYANGAIGFWECPGDGVLGEQAEFRELQVKPLD